MLGPLRRGGGGVKPPEPIRKKTLYISKEKFTKKYKPLRSSGDPDLSGSTNKKKIIFYLIK